MTCYRLTKGYINHIGLYVSYDMEYATEPEALKAYQAIRQITTRREMDLRLISPEGITIRMETINKGRKI